jgi:sodium transport system ATP-binding protein
MIEVKQVAKSFGDIKAVRDVSFQAKDGEITGLLGPNGAGKSTTIRMLYGLLQPDQGQVLIDGMVVADNPNEARRQIGALPDAYGLYPRLTARENIRYFAKLQGMKGSELEKRLDELEEILDMKDITSRRVDGFSQGQRMKVSIARAIVHRPKHVILDEPTNGLDVMTTRAMRKLIRTMKEEGCCVLFSSHIMQEVSSLCDKIIIIADGIVVAEGNVEEIRTITGEQDLEEAFVRLVIGDAE